MSPVLRSSVLCLLPVLISCTALIDSSPKGPVESGEADGPGRPGDLDPSETDPGGTGTPDDVIAASECGQMSRSTAARRLNRDEIGNALFDVLGVDASKVKGALPPDGTIGGFATVGEQLSSGDLFTTQYLELAEQVADDLVRNSQVGKACGASPTLSCLEDALSSLARRLYRGASSEETATLRQVLARAFTELGAADALRVALTTLMTSPRFLFVLPEPAEDKTRSLTARELASRLSLTLWQSVPDDALLDAAESGDLLQGTEFDAQIERMMDDPKFSRFRNEFFAQTLTLSRLDNSSIEPDAFGLSEDELRVLLADMRQETGRFIDSVWDDSAPVDTLLSGAYTFVNERLARHYGLPSVAGQELVRVELDPATGRRGLLTQGALLAQAASGDRASIVMRGDLVMAGLLCQPPPPPPASLEEVIQDLTASGATEREKMSIRAADPVCAGCHRSLDPIGWGLTAMDPLGRPATADPDGGKLDPTGVLDDTAYNGAVELSKILVLRDRITPCLVEKLLIYSVGRAFDPVARDEDGCLISAVVADARKGGAETLKQLVLSVMRSVAFRAQGTGEEQGS